MGALSHHASCGILPVMPVLNGHIRATCCKKERIVDDFNVDGIVDVGITVERWLVFEVNVFPG